MHEAPSRTYYDYLGRLYNLEVADQETLSGTLHLVLPLSDIDMTQGSRSPVEVRVEIAQPWSRHLEEYNMIASGGRPVNVVLYRRAEKGEGTVSWPITVEDIIGCCHTKWGARDY